MKIASRGLGSLVLSGLSIDAYQTNSSKLQWGACKQLSIADPSGIRCATLAVPLDYKNKSSSETLELDLVKVKAPTQPSKGSVLYNPGGPGIGGRNALLAGKESLIAYTGGVFDIVSWNTRGTGQTIPASCFANDTERQMVTTIIPDVTSSIASMNQSWAFNKRLTLACAQKLAGVGDLMGTAYTARDMVQIIDALGEDGLLRYYGASYGTALGQIFAAMFPEKVSRLVIDGVLNPHQYVTGLDYQQLASVDSVFDGFLSGCLSRPEICNLAQRDTSTKNLRQQVNDLLGRLENSPYAYGPDSSDFVTSQSLRSAIHSSLYSPPAWPALAGFLAALLDEDNKGIVKYKALLPVPTDVRQYFPDPFNLEMVAAIRCSDLSFRAADASATFPIVETFLTQSSTFGGYLSSLQSPLLCGSWPFKAKEQYTGNFDVQTKEPILVVGNVFDPITSLDAARNASGTFKGSGLLVQEGYGHSSLAQASNCTIDTIANYFINGALPETGKICRPNNPIFANATELGVE